MTRYYWVGSRKAEGFPVAAACQAAGVSTSSYYEWARTAARGPSEAEYEEALTVNEIHLVHDTLDDTYGSPRMTDELHRRGYPSNHKRIARLMRENGLHAHDARRRHPKTTIPDEGAPPIPDLVRRDFSVGEPGRRTCGDITYIRTGEGWLYMASVLDLGSRRLVGYAMADHMRSELVETALGVAAEMRDGDVAGMIFHADRGSQYMGRDFRALCTRLGVVQSVGRVASCWDNSVSESFWAIMKRELVTRFNFPTRAGAIRAITTWIRHYNAVRLHSSIGNVPPIEWELRFALRLLEAA